MPPRRKTGDASENPKRKTSSNKKKVAAKVSDKARNQLSLMKAFGSMQPFHSKKPKKVRSNGMPKLSMAAAKYAAALLNPWSALAGGSYIPIGNGRASQKTSSFGRFDLVIGTGGVGWAVFAPCVASNSPSIWVTSAAYTGSSAIPYAVALTNALNVGVTAVNIPTGYTNTNLALAYNPGSATQTTALLGRVVSAGITASYTGTTLNQGGLLYCFTDPGHLSVIGSNAASLGIHAETEVTNCSREKCFLVDFPLQESETLFDRSIEYTAAGSSLTGREPLCAVMYPFSSGATCGPDSAGASNFPAVANIPGQPTSIIFATGQAGNTIHIEYCVHLEYQGNGCEGRTTPSPIDRVGYDLVNSGVGAAQYSRNSANGMTPSESFLQGIRTNTLARKPVSSSVVADAIGM